MSTNAFKSEFDANCVCALQGTCSVSTNMIGQLMLFREAVTAYAYCVYATPASSNIDGHYQKL